MSADHRKHLVPGRQNLVWYYRGQGLSERQIAKRLGVSKTTIHYWLKRSRSEISAPQPS